MNQTWLQYIIIGVLSVALSMVIIAGLARLLLIAGEMKRMGYHWSDIPILLAQWQDESNLVEEVEQGTEPTGCSPEDIPQEQEKVQRE